MQVNAILFYYFFTAAYHSYADMDETWLLFFVLIVLVIFCKSIRKKYQLCIKKELCSMTLASLEIQLQTVSVWFTWFFEGLPGLIFWGFIFLQELFICWGFINCMKILAHPHSSPCSSPPPSPSLELSPSPSLWRLCGIYFKTYRDFLMNRHKSPQTKSR